MNYHFEWADLEAYLGKAINLVEIFLRSLVWGAGLTLGVFLSIIFILWITSKFKKNGM